MANAKIYVICDEHNNIVNFTDVPIGDNKVGMPAIFISESDALEVLWFLESNNMTPKPLKVADLNKIEVEYA